MIGRLGAGLLQDDLVRLVAGRLGMSESLAQEALRRAPRPRPRPAAGAGNGRPAAPPPRVMTSMDKVDDVERAFLARCLAVKGAGRRALGEMDLDATFSTELTRRAAHYLAEHLDTPGQSLPSDAEDLARLVAELVIRAGPLEGDPEALTLERYTLEKLRLDRQIAAAGLAGEDTTPLAIERQRVQAEISRRLV